MGEITEQPVYDTEDLRRLGQRIHLFAVPMGGLSTSIWRELQQPKDIWETNMLQPGMLDDPKEFMLRDIRVLLFDKSGPLPVFDRTGMGNLWAKSHLDLNIGMRMYWQGPLYLVADPVCILGGLDALVELQKNHVDLEATIKMLNHQREHPLDLHIRRQEYFSVQVTPYTSVCRQISVRVVLNGKLVRAVL